ncbi:MAG: TRAP transporter small permease subunit [Desulfomonilaceae bacterium]|nr:TRAP transporter small permease subunit [Desulfomonilaceae bacterium]
MDGIQKILQFIDALSECTGKAASFLILALALVFCYEVVMRYCFDSPTVWAHEFSAMLFGTAMITSGAYVLRFDGHIGMDVVYNMFSVRGRAILDVITYFVLTLPFLFVLIWFGGGRAWKSLITLEHDSTQWGPPLYLFRIMLPIGALLFFLQTLPKLARDLAVVFGGKTEERG